MRHKKKIAAKIVIKFEGIVDVLELSASFGFIQSVTYIFNKLKCYNIRLVILKKSSVNLFNFKSYTIGNIIFPNYGNYSFILRWNQSGMKIS